MSYAEDADPRFADRSADESRGGASHKPDKKPAKIAFTGEEWGFGYQATDKFIKRARERQTVPDAGLGASSSARVEREFDAASTNSGFDYTAAESLPLRTKEQALMAVKQKTADFGIVPFYHPYTGYDYESLRAMSSLFGIMGVEQIEATDTLCLAVHESQLYDLIQSSHPGTGFSALQRRLRKSWGLVDSASGNDPGGDAIEMPRAGLPVDMADQKLIRDRIDVVFAGPEAARRSKSKLDGMRAIGVDVQEISQMVEPHRELARMARSTANTSRQTNTMFDPISGETRFYSTLGAETQSGRLFGMVLPYEVAMRSSDYVIVDHNFDDVAPAKTRFMAVEVNPDPTLYEDKYRTTDAKTAYWVNRLHAIAAPHGAIGSILMNMGGYLLGMVAIALAAFGVSATVGLDPLSLLGGQAPLWLTALSATTSLVLSAAAALVAWAMMSSQSDGERGVRVMFRFRRDGTAAAIGDVENYLRNHGVAHAVTRLDEDSNSDAPASIVLDVEFKPTDFGYGPTKIVSRRIRGSVVNGALKMAFQRWKNRGVTLLAAMPIEDGQYQLPKHKPRRWWSDALGARLSETVETLFIRFSRLLFFYGLPTAIVVYSVWKFILKG